MTKQRPKVIPLFSLESRIKRALRKHLRDIGFSRTSRGDLNPPSKTKDAIRDLHRAQRNDLLARERAFIDRSWPSLKKYFADGSQVFPQHITPQLELITGRTWQSDLFRLACLTWSVPVSKGYGRRLRFLVWDKSNGKLIGLIGLGDPVFNLKVRDGLIGWTVAQRKKRLVNVMEAYVLGAIPPYSSLLCGKMIACLIRTKEVRDYFSGKYDTTRGVISRRRKHARLAMVMTTSALGRSSLYNRLKLGGAQYFTSIGTTSGWGHFHIPESLFQLIREYLKAHHHEYYGNHRFGEGPNWRLRAIRYTLSSLGLNPDLLRHGINREVFQCQLASNAVRFLAGNVDRAQYRGLLSVTEVADLALTRWVLPRAARKTDYLDWNRDNILGLLTCNSSADHVSVAMTRKVDGSGSR